MVKIFASLFTRTKKALIPFEKTRVPSYFIRISICKRVGGGGGGGGDGGGDVCG